MPSDTVFLENLHYLPEAAWPLATFTVLRAGKVAAGPNYGVRRASQVGQDVLFCLSGSGAFETGGRRIEVEAGEVVWIANEARARISRTRARPGRCSGSASTAPTRPPCGRASSAKARRKR